MCHHPLPGALAGLVDEFCEEHALLGNSRATQRFHGGAEQHACRPLQGLLWGPQQGMWRGSFKVFLSPRDANFHFGASHPAALFLVQLSCSPGPAPVLGSFSYGQPSSGLLPYLSVYLQWPAQLLAQRRCSENVGELNKVQLTNAMESSPLAHVPT